MAISLFHYYDMSYAYVGRFLNTMNYHNDRLKKQLLYFSSNKIRPIPNLLTKRT